MKSAFLSGIVFAVTICSQAAAAPIHLPSHSPSSTPGKRDTASPAKAQKPPASHGTAADGPAADKAGANAKPAHEATPESQGNALELAATAAGAQFTVDYAGRVDDTWAPGLSATGRYEFLGTSDGGQSWNFRILGLENSSSAPVTSARLSGFGFNLASDVVSATADGPFDTVEYDGNVPMLGSRDVCFRMSSGGSCAGGGGQGIAMGESLTDGSFSLLFDSAIEQLVLNDFFVRFQSIEGSFGTSGVGVGTVTDLTYLSSPEGSQLAAVPEPAAVGLIGVGLFAMAGLRRRKTA